MSVDLLFWVGGALIVEIFCCIGFRDAGYQRGYREGLEAGKKVEADWWIGAEKQIDRARQGIWKEEGRFL
jgi:hypothetical protein